MKQADQEIITLLGAIKAAQGGGGGLSEAQVQALIDASGPGYLVYTALLTQTSTDAPVATVLQNTLGGTVVWSYASEGVYTATLAGAFTDNKTAIFTSNVFTAVNRIATGEWISTNDVNLKTSRADVSFEDGNLLKTPIEIRVYP